ncbi:MAG: histone deacetylase [Opitutaceae bacterium]|nr:histone deacetylase [Opitutaceae bacterium]
MRPEQPARVTRTVPHLQAAHPGWTWQVPGVATDATLLRGHTPGHLKRLLQPRDFDADTPFFPGIADHARRAVEAACAATDAALAGKPAFSLMRPPGHHATANQAMGFCYLNQIALAALHAQAKGVARVAIWDFDAHHGNGTEAILRRRPGVLFTSVHQSPGYPGTGTTSFDNCRNWPVRPHTPRPEHMAALAASWDAVIAFKPDLVLVSAGFDSYAQDPITSMTLEAEDFATLGRWLRESGLPAAAILEGGYSADLPQLIDAFLTAWEGMTAASR